MGEATSFFYPFSIHHLNPATMRGSGARRARLAPGSQSLLESSATVPLSLRFCSRRAFSCSDNTRTMRRTFAHRIVDELGERCQRGNIQLIFLAPTRVVATGLGADQRLWGALAFSYVRETLAFRIQNLKQRIETSWAQEQTCRSDCCLGACERAFHGANPLRPILQLRMRHVRNGSVSKLGHASQEVNDKDLAHIVVRIKSFQSGNAADGFDDVVRRSTERLSRVSTSSISPSVARRSMVTSGLRARIIRSMLHTTSVGQPQPIPQFNKSCPG